LESLIKEIACKAYKTFLQTENFFLMDCFDLSIKKNVLRGKIKNNLRNTRDALDASAHNKYIETFMMNYLHDQDTETLQDFYSELFNLVILSTYLMVKYENLYQRQRLDRQKLVNNLATTIVENGLLGNNRDTFSPYDFYSKPRSRNPMHNHDFYSIQATYLQHLLLTLVVLYKRWNILPDISFSKMGQKNFIHSDIDKVGYDHTNVEHIHALYIYKHSLIDIIKHFPDILEEAKKAVKKSRGKDRIQLANIFFSAQTLTSINYDNLIEDRYYNFEEEHNFATVAQVRETLALCFEDLIKRVTSKEERVWQDVRVFMKLLDIGLPKRKNKKMNFFDKDIIGIKNYDGKIFFVKVLLDDRKVKQKNIVTRQRNFFHADRSEEYKILKETFIVTYSFEKRS